MHVRNFLSASTYEASPRLQFSGPLIVASWTTAATSSGDTPLAMRLSVKSNSRPMESVNCCFRRSRSVDLHSPTKGRRMPQSNFITAQLRESAPYLQDTGFRETAKLLIAAAEEIEMLRSVIENGLPDADLKQKQANENSGERSETRRAAQA